MRDLGKSNGRAFSQAGMRLGHPTHVGGKAGPADAAPGDRPDRSVRGTRPKSPVRVAPVSDFEGFGSFSG